VELKKIPKTIADKNIRVFFIKGDNRYILTVELGIIEKAWGGSLRWTKGLRLPAVAKKLRARGFKIEKVQVLEEF
jgi:hypothetical protein